MATGVLATPPVLQFTFNNGQLAINGSILTQVGGVNTATYSDVGLTTPLPNPIPLNSRGEISDASGASKQLFLTPNQVYTLTYYDGSNGTGNVVGTYTYVNGVQLSGTAAAASLVTVTTSPILASLVQTAAEIAAGVTPTNYAYAPGDVLRYGADPSGLVDSTTAIQAAINQNHQGGPGVYLRPGVYLVGTGHNTTTPVLTAYASTKITGDGWAAQSGSFAPVAGAGLKYMGSGAAPVISVQGVSQANYFEAPWFSGFYIYNQSAANATGIRLLFAPFALLQNLYIAGFTGTGAGIEQGNSSYQCQFSSLKIEGCTICFYSHDSGEDSLHDNCLYRSFDYVAGVGVKIANECQTTHFNTCDLSDNLYGCLISQGDSNGNGTGTPFPMQVTFTSCQFEQNNAAAIAVLTSNQSFASIKAYPSVVTVNCRFYIPAVGGSITPNTGQALIYAQACAQIKMLAPQESGYSYGAILGISQYGQTMSGTAKPGPVSFENDCYTYGTSRLISGGLNGSAVLIPGDHAICRLTSAAFTYVSGATGVPFSTIVADSWGWYNNSVTGIQPTKATTVRFKCQVYTNTITSGRVAVSLYKNGVSFIALFDQVVNAGALCVNGEAFDVPSGPGYGTGDYYQVVVVVAPGFTLNTAQSWFVAEVVGE